MEASSTATEVIAELDGQLAECLKLASTRAEHIRLTRVMATVEKLRATA